MKKILLLYTGLFLIGTMEVVAQIIKSPTTNHSRLYNTEYRDKNIERIAYPIGGIGAGMFCLEGSGAISHMSVRNNPDMFNEPTIFAAIKIKGKENSERVLEGPVPDWKKFGMKDAALGATGASWGLPRFEKATFLARFPFGRIKLFDKEIPLNVEITGWSPFIPTDADNSSLPVGAIEYTIRNTSTKSVECVFSYNAANFMALPQSPIHIDSTIGPNRIKPMKTGFILNQEGTTSKPEIAGDFAIFTDDTSAILDYCWFRGGWFDPLSMAWSNIEKETIQKNDPVENDAPGASIFIPFTLRAGEKKIVHIMMAWYVPETKLRLGRPPVKSSDSTVTDLSLNLPSKYHKPWYSSKFKNIDEVASYFRSNYETLHKNTSLFTESFYNSTLPAVAIEAVAANLTILKSPTVLRQYDGRFWAWEGCKDNEGSCAGSCTHVWNYAQALPHLFPNLERDMRNMELREDMNEEGHQTYRGALPIRPLGHVYYSAADGQLGGIMKLYREWRISGDSTWLRSLYPLAKRSIDYCIKTWDPRHLGVLEEPHHNTYDIEFWGPNSMCTGYYLGALMAFYKIGTFLGEDVYEYKDLYNKGRKYTEDSLYNGSYFYQKIDLSRMDVDKVIHEAARFYENYSDEAIKLLKKEGPKYQYGKGCLSDGVVGAWVANMCGLPDILDSSKIKSHLLSVYKNNFRTDLFDHSNPQRSTFALGHEGGLLLCSWPEGGQLTLPFIYSNEVWTGVEYQVASHLILMGRIKEGINIVSACRDRYDGTVRNPFDEYECGHWYARAMSSYGLIEAFTGVRYDAVDQILYVKSRIGDFTSFISTATGFGNVNYKAGKVDVNSVYGNIPVKKVVIM